MNRIQVSTSTATVVLNSNNYRCSGGQGDIYIKSGTVYKIYHNPKEVIPEKKIQELSVLKRDNIIVPIEHIKDKDVIIGFTTAEVKNSVPIVTLMTNTFWKSNNIKIDQIVKLVNKMKDDLSYIHSNNCLVIDGNEYNFLVDQSTYELPYFIDVDSYETKSFPATYITPSIKDYQSNSFSELTDWYSFAIVSCELFLGVHPFKGKHPKIKDMIERMKKNISIFNKDVKLNSNVRDFSYIPKEYQDWYIDVFEKGNRTKPPTADGGMVNIVVPKITVVNNTDIFELTLLREYSEDITSHRYYNGTDIVHTNNNTYLNSRKFDTRKRVSKTDQNDLVFVDHDNGKVAFESTNNKTVQAMNFAAENMFIYDNESYIKNYDTIAKLTFKEVTKAILPFIPDYKKVLPLSTEFYDGYAIVQVFKNKVFIVPYTDSVLKWAEVTIKELENYKIINGKRRKNVIMLCGTQDMVTYDKFIIKFDEKYSSYKIRVIQDVDDTNSNFDILDTGIGVHLKEGEIELFYSKFENDNIKSINDFKINGSMVITSRGQKAGLIIDNKLYSITMK
jgi:serine/threonine protein kinase